MQRDGCYLCTSLTAALEPGEAPVDKGSSVPEAPRGLAPYVPYVCNGTIPTLVKLATGQWPSPPLPHYMSCCCYWWYWYPAPATTGMCPRQMMLFHSLTNIKTFNWTDKNLPASMQPTSLAI